jgi:Ca2+-binding RTX toxin-like protein
MCAQTVQGTTGTGLDDIIDLIYADPGLAASTSQADIAGGAEAANAINHLIVDAISAGNLLGDGIISVEDVVAINAHIQANAYDAFVMHHGDDESGEETGFHLVQGDGGVSVFETDQLINTVFDGIYHIGFMIEDGHVLNEDGNRNASLTDLAHWLNYYLTGSSIWAGSAGNDQIGGNYLDDVFHMGAGDDDAYGAGGHDTMYGGDGDDWLGGAFGDDRLHGGAGDDGLGGHEGDDRIWGNLGDDGLYGGEGDDTLLGGKGDDWLSGDEGDDLLKGEAGHDGLSGDDGNDLLLGGGGHDSLGGGAGRDTLKGGAGDDGLNGGLGNDRAIGGSGEDWLAGAEGRDTLDGGAGDDGMSGDEGHDLLLGRGGSDWMAGDIGNDLLKGGNGHDTLNGGTGRDTLWGGKGDDYLRGEEGADMFLFAKSPNGADTIKDFNAEEGDVIVVESGLYLAFAAAGNGTVMTMISATNGASLGSVTFHDAVVTMADVVVDDLAFA